MESEQRRAFSRSQVALGNAMNPKWRMKTNVESRARFPLSTFTFHSPRSAIRSCYSDFFQHPSAVEEERARLRAITETLQDKGVPFPLNQ